jgi:hypothetical protein
MESRRILPFYYVAVSLAGLGLLSVLVFYSQVPIMGSQFRKQLATTVFVLICLLGILAGKSPSTCLNIIDIKGSRKTSSSSSNGSSSIKEKIRYVGHHPVCGNFSSHTISFGENIYCVGCTGLIVGAVISVIGSLIYVLFELNLGGVSQLLFWTGFIWVILGLIQHSIRDLGGFVVHLLLNILFVVGAFFLLVAVDVITESFILELYLFGLIFYWIFARTKLSQLEHEKICARCGIRNCTIA